MKRTAIASALVLVIVSLAVAQSVAVTDIAVDKLLDGVRVTIACDAQPNVSSFASDDPPAIVLDFMEARIAMDAERVESKYYPVSSVTIEPSEATTGIRIAVRLEDMVNYQVTRENNLVVVDLETAPAPPPPPPMPEDPFHGRQLTLYVKDADISDVLRMIASQFDLNILVTQDVKSVVTVRLSNVPLREAMNSLLKAGLCNMVEEPGDIIVVKPLKEEMYGEVQTRVFTLDYVEATDAAKAIARVLSDNGHAEESYRRVGDGSGSERTSVLVVTDVPEALERVAAVLMELDAPVPQIAIEAKFVETTHTSEDRYGIDWRIAAVARTGEFDIGQDYGIPLIFDEMMIGAITFDQLRANLEVLATRGNSRVLANPRTMTLDNQKATVSMGVEVPLREVNIDDQSGLITYTWRSRDIPITLEVTPHVTASGAINMKVKPTVEAITGWVGSTDDQQPIVATREAETQVTVQDGEVVVIGGLIKDEETKTISKIPLLGDIPLLGNLFKKTAVRHDKSDLMIFIIPRVMPMQG